MVTTAKRKAQQRNGRTLTVGKMRKLIEGEIKKDLALVKRPVGRPKGSTALQRVQRARELMAQSSELAVRCLRRAAKVAAEKGDSAPAEFLLKHIAVDEHGKLVRPVAVSVDKAEGGSVSKVPTINIGWAVNAAPGQPALPPASIDAETVDSPGAED